MAPLAPAPPYTVKISADFGVSSITLTNPLNPQPIVETSNAAESFTFSLGLYDAQAVGITEWAYEAIVLRDDAVIFTGPIINVAVDVDHANINFTCGGLLDYFPQRNVDRGAGRVNLLTNGDFEDGDPGDVPDGWTAVGVTAEIDNTDMVLGSQCVKLTQDNPGQNTYLQQTISDFAPTGAGDLLTGKVIAKISNADWAGPALEGWGLILIQTAVGDPDTPAGGEQAFRGNATITSDTARDTWDVRLEDTIQVVGPDHVDLIFQMMAPGGVTKYDLAGLFRMESFSPRGAGGIGVDQATVLIELIAFLQGLHVDFMDVNKNNCLITADDTSCPPTGVLRLSSWQFADHTPGITALTEYCGIDDGVDIWITPADRVFHCASPRRGTDRTAHTLTPGVNCIVHELTRDGRAGASQVVQLGDGDGPDREEAGVNDDDAFGGVTLQKIIAPQGKPAISTLQPSATRALAVASQPLNYAVELIEPNDGSTDLRFLLGMGDTVTAGFDLGYIQEDGIVRLITRSVNVARDTVTIGLNPEPA